MRNKNIEVLNFDDEATYTQTKVKKNKKVLISDDFTTGTSASKKKIDNTNDKKDTRKRSYGIGEKIFVTLSVLFIIGCFIFYGYRTFHYYHVTHDVVKNITLNEKLTALTNIAYQNDGLYEKTGYFYYKGVDVNNFVYYSGRLFRIIDISDGIRMIEADTNTNLVWTIESDFENSYIHDWLNNYLKTLKDYDLYLEKNKWCNDKINLEKYSCNKTIDDYVGLLSSEDYLQAGGKNSYLNNETYFWLINQDQDGNVLYVNNEGNINNIYKKEDNYFSYGIRPVIKIKKDISIISGDGSEDDPYVIEYLGDEHLKNNSIGSYVEYNDELYRILNIDDYGVSLIYDGVLEVEKSYNDVYKYLNNEFIKKLNKKDLVKNTYYINEYSFNNKYIRDNKNKKSDYVVIPNIGNMFLNEVNNYWLNDYSDNKLGLYYTLDENQMFFADLSGSKHYIRPIIKLNLETKVTGGTGVKNDPLVISKEGEKNAEKN